MLGNPLLLGDDGYTISRSLRLRSSASAYFNRTPASATNRKTWTWSGWVKRGQIGVQQQLVIAENIASNYYFYIRFLSSDIIEIFDYNATGGSYLWQLSTTQVFRDPSAWYHIVYAVDTTQATAANRVKLYVNGVQVSTFSTANYPSQNFDTQISYNGVHNIGRYITGSSYFDGYITEVNFIDGQALDPSYFGQTDPVTGVWKPKKYAGTYGTNGFYLNFSDPSAATAAAIGKDSSGNGNNWTPNNISVTAGATYDSMIDVPTMYADGGNGRGNYAVINPVSTPNAGGIPAIADGNLRMVGGTANSGGAWSTMALPTTGQFYVESAIEFTTGSYQAVFGVADNNSTSTVIDVFVGDTSANQVRVNGSNVQAFTPTSGDVFSLSIDCGTGIVIVKRNNTTIYTSGSLAVGGKHIFVYRSSNAGQRLTFGQQPFAYTPPTGFLALNTQNLPDSTIKKGASYFDATTYLGNGGTQTVSNLSFQPDLVWIKNRSAAANHALLDSVRTSGYALYPNLTDAEANNSTLFTGISGNSFSLAGGNATYNAANNYISWLWKKGATPGFDIVTYTGNGANRTIAHSLGVAPKMIIVKKTGSGPSGNTHWNVYHANLTSAAYTIYLSLTNAQDLQPTIWNSTAPSSSVFSIGTSGAVNDNATPHVAYLFSEVAGFSKFGSYTGNGSADGPFVYCGFRPKFVMVKRTDTTSDWVIQDTTVNTSNVASAYLSPNTSGAEGSFGFHDILSNGFKLRQTNTTWNTSGGTYIFAAFAENPFKNALAR